MTTAAGGLQFRKGADSLAEAAKGSAFAKTHFFGIEDKERAIIRLLTEYDEWINVKQHQMVRVQQPKPADAKSWPEKMGCVCRNAVLEDGRTVGQALAEVLPPDCFICDNLVDGTKLKAPAARGWAWACLREEVIEGGVRKGMRDMTREVAKTDKEGKPTGEVSIEKAIVLVNMGHKNFFNALKGFAAHYGTVLDRDYYITREGAGTDTDYHIVPGDPTGLDLRDDETMVKRYGKTRAAFYESLAEEVSSRADDRFYARFFDTRFTIDKDDNIHPSGKTPTPVANGGPAPVAPSNDVDDDRLAALQQRVQGYTAGDKVASDASPPPAPAPAAAPAQEAPAAQPVAAGMAEYD